MKVRVFENPREFHFSCPSNHDHVQKDCGEISLEDGELVSFISPSGKKSDVVGKGWGWFMTQSANSRLKNQGLKVALVRSKWHRLYVVVVEDPVGFLEYMNFEGYTLVSWLDEEESLK